VAVGDTRVHQERSRHEFTSFPSQDASCCSGTSCGVSRGSWIHPAVARMSGGLDSNACEQRPRMGSCRFHRTAL